MKVWIVTPEVVPFSKTGGLADVSGALPKALAELGVEVTVITPLYRAVRRGGPALEPVGPLSVPIENRKREGKVWRGSLPGGKVPVYFLEQDAYYDREHLYSTPDGDYPDNCERFVFLSRGALELARTLKVQPDILHVHDWQAGLLPVYLRTLYAGFLPAARSVLTIHNLGYQGVFWHWDMPLTGLDWSHFNWRELEFFGKLNLLKGAVIFADRITTVSPTYAREIQTEEFGAGLEGVLLDRGAELVGILNGVDYGEWDPEGDRHIARKYGRQDRQGKAECKRDLQRRLGLEVDPRVPVVGLIGRLTPQKGFDLFLDAAPDLARERAQYVVLGAGEAALEEKLAALGKQFPSIFSVQLKFDEGLAHRIEAGADLFLMPSRYEPCGLNQIYSMRYGTIPVVRGTGGLADTVVDTTPMTLAKGTATGFVFRGATPEAVQAGVLRGLLAFHDPSKWDRVVENAMGQDFSWGRSAKRYVEVFEQALRSPPHSAPEG